MYIPGLSCSGKGLLMGPSSSGVVNTPVPPQAAFSVGQFLPCCGFISKPSPSGLTQHGFPWTGLLCQTPTPSKSAFSACLCPLTHSSSISFLQAGLFAFLFTCPVFVSSCVFSHIPYCFPLYMVSCTSCTATLSHECLSQCAVPFSGRLVLLHPVGQSVSLGFPCFLN